MKTTKAPAKKPATKSKRVAPGKTIDVATARREILIELQKKVPPEHMKLAEVGVAAVFDYVDEMCERGFCVNMN